MKYLLLLIVILKINSAYSQEFIAFDYHCGSCKSNSDLNITFLSSFKSDSLYVIVKSESNNIDKKINISRSEYISLVKAAKKVSSIDLIKGFKSGSDGAETSIRIYDFFNEVSYNIWGLNLKEKNKNLKDFIKTTLLILEAAKINPNQFYH